MSYDIDIIDPAGGGSAFSTDPTYNLTPIFDLALTGEPLPNAETSEFAVVVLHEKTDRPRGLRILDGWKCADSLVPLRKALGHLKDPAKEASFREFEPSNGWGTLESAVIVIQRLIDEAERFPSLTWKIR